MTSRSQVTVRTIWTIALHLLLLFVVLVILHRVRAIVGWILIALLLALALEPVVSWLERKGIRRGLGILAVFVFGAALMSAALAALVPMFIAQASGLIAAAPDLIEAMRHSFPFEWLDTQFDVVDRAKSYLTEHTATALNRLLWFVRAVFTGLLATVSIIALCIFMLLFGRQLVAGALAWVEPRQRDRFATMAERVRRSVGGYVSGTLIIAAIGGVVTTIALLLIGVPYYLALGMAMAFLGIIPFIGATVGGILIIGTTFVTSGTTAGLIAVIVFVGYQQVENQILQPLVQRRTIHMNPLIIILVLLAGTALAGILGALLALPIAGATQVVLDDVLERRKARWAAGGADPSEAATT